jgi:hypothetical protein
MSLGLTGYDVKRLLGMLRSFTGAGKSTFINCIRGLVAGDRDFAHTSAGMIGTTESKVSHGQPEWYPLASCAGESLHYSHCRYTTTRRFRT